MELDKDALLNVTALHLLQSFIKDSFPTAEPEKQVATAFLYASLIVKFKEETKKHLVATDVALCPDCGGKLNLVDVGTLDRPNAKLIFCSNCGNKPAMTDVLG